MSGSKDAPDAFLTEIGEEGVQPLVDALSTDREQPRADLRAGLLAELRDEGRFSRFTAELSALLDIDRGAADALLDGIGDPARWQTGALPNVLLHDIDGGPRVQNAITGFVRMTQGAVFPAHGHVGEETALILQGSAIDGQGEIWRVGDVVKMRPGTKHSFAARPGPDLLFMVIVQEGLEMGGQIFGPETKEF